MRPWTPAWWGFVLTLGLLGWWIIAVAVALLIKVLA